MPPAGGVGRGKKLLNVASVAFLVISIFAVAYSTSSGAQLLFSQAKSKAQKTWRDIGNPRARQAARSAAEADAAQAKANPCKNGGCTAAEAAKYGAANNTVGGSTPTQGDISGFYQLTDANGNPNGKYYPIAASAGGPSADKLSYVIGNVALNSLDSSNPSEQSHAQSRLAEYINQGILSDSAVQAINDINGDGSNISADTINEIVSLYENEGKLTTEQFNALITIATDKVATLNSTEPGKSMTESGPPGSAVENEGLGLDSGHPGIPTVRIPQGTDVSGDDNQAPQINPQTYVPLQAGATSPQKEENTTPLKVSGTVGTKSSRTQEPILISIVAAVAESVGIDVSGISQAFQNQQAALQVAKAQNPKANPLALALNPVYLVNSIEVAKVATTSLANIMYPGAGRILTELPLVGANTLGTASQRLISGIATNRPVEGLVGYGATALGIAPIIESSNRLFYQTGLTPEEADYYRTHASARVMDAVTVGLTAVGAGDFVASGVVQGIIPTLTRGTLGEQGLLTAAKNPSLIPKAASNLGPDLAADTGQILKGNIIVNGAKVNITQVPSNLAGTVSNILNPQKVIKPGEVFDPQAELQNILGTESSPKTPQQQAQALADFKAKYAYQQEGLIKIQSQLEKTITKNPDIGFEALTSQADSLASEYGLADWQKENLRSALGEYSTRRIRINELFDQFKTPESMYEAMFGKKPVGQVEFAKGTSTIHIKIFNADDYNYAYNGVINSSYDAAGRTGGFFRPFGSDLLPRTQGLLVIENDTSLFLRTQNSFLNKVFTHEDQHALFNLLQDAGIAPERSIGSGAYYNFNSALRENPSSLNFNRALNDYVNELVSDANVRTANEMLAYLKENSYSDIVETISRPKELGGLYDFYGRERISLLKEVAPDHSAYQAIANSANERLSLETYRSTINEGLGAFETLVTKGFTRDEAIAALEKQPLSSWSKFASRVSSPTTLMKAQGLWAGVYSLASSEEDLSTFFQNNFIRGTTSISKWTNFVLDTISLAPIPGKPITSDTNPIGGRLLVEALAFSQNTGKEGSQTFWQKLLNPQSPETSHVSSKTALSTQRESALDSTPSLSLQDDSSQYTLRVTDSSGQNALSLPDQTTIRSGALTISDSSGQQLRVTILDSGLPIQAKDIRTFAQTIQNLGGLSQYFPSIELVMSKNVSGGFASSFQSIDPITGKPSIRLVINPTGDVNSNIAQAIGDATKFGAYGPNDKSTLKIAYDQLFSYGKGGAPGNYFYYNPQTTLGAGKNFDEAITTFLTDPNSLKTKSPAEYAFFNAAYKGYDPLSIQFVNKNGTLDSSNFDTTAIIQNYKQNLASQQFQFMRMGWENIPSDVRNNNIGYQNYVNGASKQYNVPIPIIVGVMQLESGGDVNREGLVYGSYGAVGIMQVLPNMSSYSKSELKTAGVNIQEGTRILRAIYDDPSLGNGNWRDTVALYNVGDWESLLKGKIGNSLIVNGGFVYADDVLEAGGINPDAVKTTQ